MNVIRPRMNARKDAGRVIFHDPTHTSLFLREWLPLKMECVHDYNLQKEMFQFCCEILSIGHDRPEILFCRIILCTAERERSAIVC